VASAAATMPTATMPALGSGAVFSAPIMAGISGMTSPVSRFIRMEMIERLLPTLGNRAIVAPPRIIAIVNVAVKAVTAMKPWAGSNE
jgi:hypothetical protein